MFHRTPTWRGHHTCIRCGVQSANRSRPGESETAVAQSCHRTPGRHVAGGFGVCVDELLHSSCLTGAWEENTLCMTGKQQKKKRNRIKFEFIFISLEDKFLALFPRAQKTHSGLCWFDFLEMLHHLFFAAELSLTLGTFITVVLHCLCFLIGFCFMWLECWVCSSLA